MSYKIIKFFVMNITKVNQHDTFKNGEIIMLKVPDGRVKEFGDAVMNHKVNVSAMNVYFQNIRMLNGKHKYIDRDTYSDVFKHALSDIELVSSPIDSFVPADNDDEHGDELFYVNQLMPEYVEISERLTIDVLKTELGTAHPAIVALINNECTLDRLIDDIYIYYCLFKYLEMIDIIQIKSYSYLTPIIEWIVDNVTLKDIKGFMHSKNFNPEKYTKNFEDLIFNPEFAITHKFYAGKEGNVEGTSLFCDSFDIGKLMIKLASNIVIKSDVFWIIGIYMICSFAIFDKGNPDSKITKYVSDVISKIL